MKLNWRTFKIVVALAIVVGTIFWVVDSVRPRSYSGANLNFGFGSGPVTVTNPLEDPVRVQLVSPGTRSFTFLSTIDGVSGSSTRQGSGSTATQVVELDLPSGVSEFTLTRGTNVSFVTDTIANLAATVQPTDATQSRTILIVAAVVILGMLFYISRLTGHRWINVISSKNTPEQDTRPGVTDVVDGGQGRAARSYGDNRVDLPS